MPSGRHGGEARGGEASDLARRFDALERLVLSLRGGGGKGEGGPRTGDQRSGAAGGKSAGGRGAKGGAPGGGGKGTARGRQGDWKCGACEAYPCFARTSRCYQCGAPRVDDGPPRGQRPGGGGAGGRLAKEFDQRTYLGPQGAGGSRPLLGGRGVHSSAAAATRQPDSHRPPSTRVPGASVAAKAEADRRARQADREDSPGARMGNNDDGFQLVRGGAPARSTAWGGSSSSGQLSSPPRAAAKTSWAALAEEEDEEEQQVEEAPMQCDEELPARPVVHDAAHELPRQGDRHGDDGDDADGEGEDEGEELDEAALKRDWLAHCAACRLLEKDGRAPQQLVAEAKAQRDSAERRWRAAKTPHPLSKRLRWAEAELRDAEAKELARRSELEAHLAQAERRTKELEERLGIDAARTARKREAVERLHREGAGCQARPPAERAAIIAATGISMDVAPALMAAIEKLGSPTNEEQEATWRELQLAAVSLSRVEEVLREGVQPPAAKEGPAQYDIGDDEDDDEHRCDDNRRTPSGGRRDTGDKEANGMDRPPAAAAVPRWTKAPNNGPWRRSTSSVAAVEEARSALRRRTEPASGVDAARRSGGGDEKVDVPEEPAGQSGATTNDLAEAERREREAAQRQWHESQQQQAREKSTDQLQQEEQLRQQREQRRVEELQRHQAEAQRAAEARAAEESRQRDQLIANMSPEQLALAAEVHAQQMAIGAKAFGTQEAAQMAGLAHQAHVQRTLQEAEERGRQADADHLMAMSPEDFAQWNRDCQEDW